MDIAGINSYADQIGASAKTQAAEKKLKDQLERTRNSQDPEKLLDACKQFEQYMWEQVYKSMQKTVDAFRPDGEKDGYASEMVDYFSGSAIQEIASRTTETSNGQNSLAQILYEQMKRNYGITD